MNECERFYLSGKITGTDDYIERFNEAEAYVSYFYSEIVNPAKMLSLLPESTTHKEYMHISYALLDICDTIYMLEGWEESKGATLELEYAICKGMRVVYEKDKV